MKNIAAKVFLVSTLISLLSAGRAAASPALTIYNQDFAVVRDTVPLDLNEGVNDVSYAETTAQVEPDSVILRDPDGVVPLHILEQNYRNDPVTQDALLSLYEGKTINFLIDGKPVPGKIIRSGYTTHTQPVIEMNGSLQFGLPGQPIFPSLGDDTILKPTLVWKIATESAVKLNAELAYITQGMSWKADYNVVAPEHGDLIDIVGWVTMNNQTGKTFTDAQIKLMAGDVNIVQPEGAIDMLAKSATMSVGGGIMMPQVTQKAFDDFHLYSLPGTTTLRDAETKQVEFIRATGVQAEKVYVYDGATIDWNRWRYDTGRQSNAEFGAESDTKVATMWEFKNSKENHLGMPLPAGRLRFYRHDDKQLEFVGENDIDHTPQDETVRVYTGNAFDLVGERKQTNFKVDNGGHWADESYEITLHNHKTEPAEIRVVEHVCRWTNWDLTTKSDDFTKTNSQEIEFRIPLKPGEDRKVSYTVHYTW